MSPEQCRAARAWLNWSQHQLAAKAQVSDSTIRDFEAARRVPHANNLHAIRTALEAEHITFAYSADGTAIGVSHLPPDLVTTPVVIDVKKKPKAKAAKRRR